MKRALAMIGDPRDVRSWSGTPYYLFREAARRDVLHIPLRLDAAKVRVRRRLWNLSNLLMFRKYGGYQYTEEFHEALLRQACEQADLGQCEVVSHLQLFPPVNFARRYSIPVHYYLDRPLLPFFRDAAAKSFIWSGLMTQALERERELYSRAQTIVCMARWAASVIETEYKIPPSKVRIVLPGANLDETLVEKVLLDRGPRRAPQSFTKDRPLVLGLTGRDWVGKGLARLVRAVEILDSKGFNVVVSYLGAGDTPYSAHPLVISHGFVSKNADGLKFLKLLDACALGCSPSQVEAMGIAPMEFLRLGIPVLCARIGGFPDIALRAGESAILFPEPGGPEEIAAVVEPLIKDPSRLDVMYRRAWNTKEYFSWSRAVAELSAVWDAPTR